MGTRPESRLLLRGRICRKPSNGEDDLSLTTGSVHPANQEPEEIYSTSGPSSVGSSRPQSQLSDALSLALGQTLTDGPWINLRSVDNIPRIYPAFEASSQLIASNNSNSVAQLRELWYHSFDDGCWSNEQWDLYATHLVACGPWFDISTPNLLAKMFMSQYFRVFANPWAFSTGTLRIMRFLEAVENHLKEQRGMVMLLKFQVCMRQAALDAFHLSIDLVSVFPLTHCLRYLIDLQAARNILAHACFLGAMFRHGPVHEEDMLCALARIARLAEHIGHFQAFYYLLMEAGEAICSQPRAIQEIQQHAWELMDTLISNREPVRGISWYYVRSPLAPSLG